MKLFRTILIVAVIVSVSGCMSDRNKTDWSYHFESQYKTPYGLYVFREELDSNLHRYANFTDIKERTALKIDSFKNDNYNAAFIYINPVNYIDYYLAENIKTFAKGNTAFISSNIFDEFRTDNFSISTSLVFPKGNDIKLNLIGIDDAEKSYLIKSRGESFYYFNTIPQNAEVLGNIIIDGKNYPNFIKIPSDSINRALYLHSTPYFFANYYLLRKNSYKYAFDVAAYWGSSYTFYWDGYRTRARYLNESSDGSSLGALKFIWSKPPLKFAFILFFSAIAIFLLFNYKRIQNPMPVFAVPENKTLSFIQLVALLFMKQKNKHELSVAKINFFLDKVRVKYLLSTAHLNEEFIEKLSLKSGADRDVVKNAVEAISKLREKEFVSNKEFFNLNKTIEQFTNKSNFYD